MGMGWFSVAFRSLYITDEGAADLSDLLIGMYLRSWCASSSRGGEGTILTDGVYGERLACFFS